MQSSENAPAFNKTMQIGIVVPDVEVAARAYQERYGNGGWTIMEIGSENTDNVRFYRQPLHWTYRRHSFNPCRSLASIMLDARQTPHAVRCAVGTSC